MNRQVVLIVACFALYLLLGTGMFMLFETYKKDVQERLPPEDWILLKDYLLSTDVPLHQLKQELARFVDICKNDVTAYASNLNITSPYDLSLIEGDLDILCDWSVEKTVTKEVTWAFWDSMYFSMTVITTIGYGHMSPVTVGGRIFCIIYAFLGVPFTGVLLAASTDYFSRLMHDLYSRQTAVLTNRTLAFVAASLLYLLPGLFIFLFLPAGLFVALEDWTYLEAFYYCFITLTTIGFGDFVTAREGDLSSHWLYNLFVLVWIMTGLGYWMMMARFIAKALKSKTMKSVIAQQADDFRQMMQNLGLLPQQTDFVHHHSKATMAFMLQLACAIDGSTFRKRPGADNDVMPQDDIEVRGSFAGPDRTAGYGHDAEGAYVSYSSEYDDEEEGQFDENRPSDKVIEDIGDVQSCFMSGVFNSPVSRLVADKALVNGRPEEEVTLAELIRFLVTDVRGQNGSQRSQDGSVEDEL